MTQDSIKLSEQPSTFGIGLLGAVMPSETMYAGHAQSIRDEMIERRILRIEMALRRAGIEVEELELPRPRQ